MARAKKAADSRQPTADSKPEWVEIRVAKSFDLMTIGEVMQAPLSERVLALIAGGFMEVTAYGPSASGPEPAEPRDQGGEPEGPAPESSAGAEPGEDPRAG